MKVLIDHGSPFLLAHGGFQVQIEQTRRALAAIGVEAEYLRWWDDAQTAQIIHRFGSLHAEYVRLAHAKGIKIVLSELRTAAGSRSPRVLAAQKLIARAGLRLFPRALIGRLGWDIYEQVDAATALTEWEAHIIRSLTACPPDRLHVIPNGVEDEFFDDAPAPPLDWLVCTATIHPRKRVLELARAAVVAQVPVWIIGRPYSDAEPYFRDFAETARAHPRWIRFEGAIDDRRRLAGIYRGARGFVLASSMESQSLSALEAAASRCPLLLSDLPWARTTFGERATYVPRDAEAGTLARHLRAFWEADHRARSHFVPLRWTQVAERLRDLYASLLSTSR